MARSRNIKPGFFMNDELAEIEPLGRLLFAGLWCIADREGRLEDRPKRIKAEVLPYDECDIEGLLNQLAKRDFIVRYEIDGNSYIQITNFSKHQNPHKNEAASIIPAPECSDKSTIQAPERSDTNPADSLNMIPDSFNLGTDSLEGPGEPNNQPEEEIKNTTPEEREILSVLKSIELYPFDYSKDLQFIRDLAIDYPGLDLLYQVKKWRDYKRDKPLNKKSSPRAQLRNWMNKANEWSEENGKTGGNTARGHPRRGHPRADPAGKYREFVSN